MAGRRKPLSNRKGFQKGRRNLSGDALNRIVAKLYNIRKKKEAGGTPGNKNAAKKRLVHGEPIVSVGSTAESVAKDTGVSASTVKRIKSSKRQSRG